MADPGTDGRAGLEGRLAELERANADARAGRRAALNLLEDAVQARDALRESRAFHELVADLGSAWWFSARIDPDGTAVTEAVGGGFTRLLGYTREELMAAGGWEVIVHPEDRPEAGRQMARLLAGEAIEGELRHVARDGRVTWSQYRTRPERDAAGRVARVYGVARDITERKRAERELAEGRLRFERIAAATPGMLYLFDLADGRNVYVNDGVERVLGYSAAEVAAFGPGLIPALVHPDDLPAVEAGNRGFDRLADGAVYEHEYRMRHADGSWRWLKSRDTVFLRGPGGAARQIIGLAEDVTGRKAAEAALRASEEQFRRAIEEAPIPVIMHAEDGEVLRISRTWTELTGYALPDVPTVDAWLTRAYGPGADAVRAHMHELFAGDRRTLDVEFVIRTRAGTDRHWSFSAGAPGALRDGRRFVVGMAVDITDRQRAEAALRASEARFRAVAANLPGAAVFVVGPDLRYAVAEGQAFRDAGFTPADFEGKTVAEAVGPDLAPGYEASYRKALAGEPFAWEHAAHGRHYLSHGVPLRDAAGAATAALAVSYDITARKRAEEEVRASEERHRLLVESVRDHAIFGLDPGGVVTTWNPAAGRVFGYAADEIIGRPGHVFFTPEDRAAGLPDRELKTAAAEGRANDENWAVRKDGSRFWASGASSAVREADGRLTGFVKVVRDRTEEREAEEAVRRAEERLRLALAAARMGIWVWHVSSNTQTRDANLNQMLGLPAAESTQPFGEFFGHMHPDDRAATAEAFRASVARGLMLNTEFRIVRPDGTVRWLRDQGDVIGRTDGPDQHMTGACVDITELKEAEAGHRQARDELELRVKERTAELEAALAARRELAARLATAQEDERRRIARDLHDSLGQYVAALALGLKAAEAEAGPAAPVADRLRRLGELTQAVGRETHRLALELRPTVLDDAGLETAVRTYVETWAEQTGIPAEFTSRGLSDEAFPPEVATAVYRAVQEALTNVLKHAGASRVGVLLERRARLLTAIVEDDGRGFDPDARPAPSAAGGLGLVGMRERIAMTGGTLQIESEPGAGTTVYIRIPLPEGS